MGDFNEFNDSRYVKTATEGIFTFRQIDLQFVMAYDLFVDDRPLGEIDRKSNGHWWAFRFVGIEEPLMTEEGQYNNGKLDQTFKTRKEAAEALWAERETWRALNATAIRRSPARWLTHWARDFMKLIANGC